jgi:hypothetical protein
MCDKKKCGSSCCGKEKKFPECKACGMPMKKPEDFGTNADKSKNMEYCKHCLKNGKKS